MLQRSSPWSAIGSGELEEVFKVAKSLLWDKVTLRQEKDSK
jgi:hypothetical protein